MHVMAESNHGTRRRLIQAINGDFVSTISDLLEAHKRELNSIIQRGTMPGPNEAVSVHAQYAKDLQGYLTHEEDTHALPPEMSDTDPSNVFDNPKASDPPHEWITKVRGLAVVICCSLTQRYWHP